MYLKMIFSEVKQFDMLFDSLCQSRVDNTTSVGIIGQYSSHMSMLMTVLLRTCFINLFIIIF